MCLFTCSLEELLLAVDPQRPDSLIRELRQTSGMGSHITQTVSEIKRNIRKLQDVCCYQAVKSLVYDAGKLLDV